MLDIRRLALGKAFDVHFINDAIAERTADVPVSFPVECIVNDYAFRRTNNSIGCLLTATGQRFGVGIDQSGVAVKPLPRFRIKWSVGLQMVELSRLDVWYANTPNIAPTIVASIEFDNLGRFTVVHMLVQQ